MFVFYPFFFLMLPPPPRSTLFPYTTLFRSLCKGRAPPTHEAGLRRFDFHDDQPDTIRRCQNGLDRKSTRLNSSHTVISYAVFCLKKKNKTHSPRTSRIFSKMSIVRDLKG